MPAPDETARLRAQLAELTARHAFLAQLDAATQPLADPSAVMAVSARLLAEHLDVSRCAYANVEDERIFEITGDHARGVASIVGRWEVAAFGPACVEHMRANRPFVVSDSATDPRVGPAFLASYQATEIRAVICVPLHKDGRFTAAMAVHQATPRVWTSAEIDLVGVVVARCWEALERAGAAQTRALAEAALAQSRARLDYTVKLAGVGFWYCDLPFDVLEWDVRVKDHFWLPPDARVTIEVFYERIHPDDRGPTRTAIESSIEGKSSYDIIYRTVHPTSGAVKYIRALGGTAYAIDGSPIQFDGITVDVTAQRRDQDRLLAIADELRDQDRRKDEFLATLAHELRNPLAPIRTGLQLLRVSTDEAQGRRTREMMERQLGHLVHMVDDLLDISRVTLGKITLVKETVGVRTLLESALETVRPLVDAQHHTLALEVPDDTMLLAVDPTRIAQVIANLVSNAAKYTPPHGHITVAAARDAATQEVVLSVTDTGIGIPSEMLPRVFEMFMQLGQSIDRSQGGLGLGLTLVRRLVEMHGGTVAAHSPGLGKGSTFVVRLPVVETAPASRPDVATTAASAALRILVVDDNLDGAETLAMLLELGGHQTHLAHSGPAAVEAAIAFRPQIVFLDIGLPGFDGYEVAKRLRANHTLARPFLVAVTGWGAEEDRQRAMAAGFDRHLVKPIDAARINELIASVPTAGS